MGGVVADIVEAATTAGAVGIDLIEPAVDAVTAEVVVDKAAAGGTPTAVGGAPAFAELGSFRADADRAVVAVVGLHDRHPEHVVVEVIREAFVAEAGDIYLVGLAELAEVGGALDGA